MAVPDPRIVTTLNLLRSKDRHARRAVKSLFRALGLPPDVVDRVHYTFHIAGAAYHTRVIPVHKTRIEALVALYPHDPDQFYISLSRLVQEFSQPIFCAFKCLVEYVPPATLAKDAEASLFGGGIPAPGCCTFNDRTPPYEFGWSHADCLSMPTHVAWDQGPCPVDLPEATSKLTKGEKKPKAASKKSAAKK